MYFLSLDFVHAVFLSCFLAATLAILFFRHKKYLSVNGKTVNYAISGKIAVMRTVSLALCIVLLGIAFLGPVGLMGNISRENPGMDCIWLLDVSMSMDTQDVKGNSQLFSRLESAKSLIESYMISHPENRYGLVVFAGKSRLVSPLTSEYTSLLSFLVGIDSKSIREGGTDFRDAISVAVQRFETADHAPHAVVLLSDGGDPEDMPDPDIVRSIFQGKNVNLITVGFGQTKPSPIPIGRDAVGDMIYKKFRGETVLSWLNRKNLESLAEMGKWSYLEWDSLQKSLDRSLSAVSRTTVRSTSADSDDITVRALIMASFFFFLAFLLLPSSVKKPWNAL